MVLTGARVKIGKIGKDWHLDSGGRVSDVWRRAVAEVHMSSQKGRHSLEVEVVGTDDGDTTSPPDHDEFVEARRDGLKYLKRRLQELERPEKPA